MCFAKPEDISKTGIPRRYRRIYSNTARINLDWKVLCASSMLIKDTRGSNQTKILIYPHWHTQTTSRQQQLNLSHQRQHRLLNKLQTIINSKPAFLKPSASIQRPFYRNLEHNITLYYSLSTQTLLRSLLGWSKLWPLSKITHPLDQISIMTLKWGKGDLAVKNSKLWGFPLHLESFSLKNHSEHPCSIDQCMLSWLNIVSPHRIWLVTT